MLTLPPSVRIFICTEPTDMRRSFDGLVAMVEELVCENPFSGHLFLFRNRRRDRVKVLWWDRDGLCIVYKRLEQGTYELPSDGHLKPAGAESSEDFAASPARWEIHADELAMLLGGIDLKSARRRKRYRRPTRSKAS